MKIILCSDNEKMQDLFSSAEILVEHKSGLLPCPFILRLCNSKYLIYNKA